MKTLPIEHARAMLPHLPDEVFSLWITPIIKLNGWPFTSLESEFIGHFSGYFCGLNLNEVAQLRWHRDSIPFTQKTLSPDYHKGIYQMTALHGFNIQQSVQVPDDSRDRWMRCLAYIEEEGKFPAPIILLGNGHDFKIFDGHHRLSALLKHVMNGHVEPFHMDCWVASPLSTGQNKDAAAQPLPVR